ncbi:hypothetical protein [uncultured Selenomonas sp.]|uniref:hypothetical protein n=1 Tax=uncultured Selenomonas sp. TaxID=159275 RepID=UPI0025E6BF92|nr:hypothetical protein [uncultured Selenomonas sp.]
MGVAILLTVLFGPLGLLYSTVKGGIIMIVVAFVVGFLTLGFGALITWPVAIVWSYIATKKYNEQLYSGSSPQE